MIPASMLEAGSIAERVSMKSVLEIVKKGKLTRVMIASISSRSIPSTTKNDSPELAMREKRDANSQKLGISEMYADSAVPPPNQMLLPKWTATRSKMIVLFWRW